MNGPFWTRMCRRDLRPIQQDEADGWCCFAVDDDGEYVTIIGASERHWGTFSDISVISKAYRRAVAARKERRAA